jgi:chromosome segregation ATPase
MHIKIESERRRGLRIIDEIPDMPLCKIQGHNGIGKTNAIKLLSLCTGATPFRGDAAAWASFKSQLLAARVKISGLRDGEILEWDLEPKSWPDDPGEPLGDFIGALRINGRKANLRDVFDILRVHHIVAAETPQNVLASRVLEAQKDIQGWDSQRQSRVDSMDEHLASIHALITHLSPEKIASEVLAVREARTRATSLTDKRETATERMGLLQRAKQVSDQLVEVRGQGPEMDAKLGEFKAQLEAIEQKKEELNHRIAEASARQHQDAEAEREFANAQKYLDRHDRAARNARTALDMLAASAEVDPERDVIDAAIREASAKLTELTELLPQVHAAPLVLEVLDDLVRRLSEAERENLGHATLLEDGGGSTDWTVVSLREALSRQREILGQRTPSADAARLSDEIEKTRDRLYSLAQAKDTLAEFEAAESALSKAQVRLRNAAEGLPEQAARTLDDLMVARNELDQEAAKVQTRHARLTHTRELLGGGLDEESLSAELAQLCKRLGVRISRIHSQVANEAEKFEEIVRAETQAVQQAERAQQSLERRERETEQVLLKLQTGEELGWVRNAVDIAQVSSMSLEQKAAVLCRVSAQLDRARNRLHLIDEAVRGTGTALSKLQAGLQTGTGQEDAETPYDAAARHWLGREVQRWFEDEFVRKALFEGGAQVRLDAHDMSIVWVNKNGEEERRPLTGFSSGQQVLAYTQAQIAKIDAEELPAANRLIALDEFGAFLDWKNMSSLVNLLKVREPGVSRDQVVVILPLEGDRLSGHGDTPVDGQFRSLENRGYFAEELTT